MKQNFANIPIGVLDTDSDLTGVSPDNFIASVNMRQHPGERVRRNIKGNELVPYFQPFGINETIGHVEDKYHATGIEFVKNNGTVDQIRRYWVLENRYELLWQMNMNFANRISEAGVIDGRHLFWTDWNGETGSEPRYLDMELASLYQKKLCYELYWDSNSFQNNEQYFIRITTLAGVDVLPSTVFFTATGLLSINDAQNLALALAPYNVTVEFCPNKIKVCANVAEQRVYITGQGIHFTPINHYPVQLFQSYISLARMMPKQPPAPRFVADAAIFENKVFGFTFQFRYRYVYWNGAKSKWGPISYVPTNFIDDGLAIKTIDNSELYNKVVISLDDKLLDNQDQKAFIRRIELAVRYEQSGAWKLVDTFDVADLGVSIHEIPFLNDGTYPEIASDEVADGTIQALGNQDFVPRRSRSLEIIQDETGRHLLALGGNKERFGQVDCVDALVESIYDSPQVSAPFTPADQASLRKRFKAGGIYDVFVIYEDDLGNQWPSKKLGRFNCVNPIGAAWEPGRVYPRVTLNHLPPIEATRYRIGFSKNTNQGQYVVFPCYTVTYWKRDPHPTGGDGTFTSTTYAAGDADFVSFQLYVRDLNSSQINFLFRDDERNMLVQDGDRLHVTFDTIANAFTKDDYLVEGYNFSGPAGTSPANTDHYFVFIKFTAGMPDYSSGLPVNQHHLIELYRPLKGDSDVVYEIGQAHDIVNAGLATRNHGAPVDITDLGDAYTYSYKDKDWLHGGTPDTQISFSERPSLYAFKKEVGSDFGRPNAEDPDFREVDSYDQIRLSDFYIPQTGINGFHSFRGVNYIRTRRDYGSLQSLQFCAGELLAIGQFGTQPIYVSKDRLMTLDGATVGRSANVLNIGQELTKMRGTHSPMSIVNTGQYVYGFDEYLGVPWRWSHGGGIDDINIGNIDLFRNLGKQVFDAGRKCVAGYQEEFDTYFITFGQLRTMGFVEKRGWEGSFTFIPDCYGSIGLKFFSFLIGNAWKHEANNYCTFYGLPAQAYIIVVVNPESQAVKLFWNFRHQGTKIAMPYINIPPGITPNGMDTRILSAKFSKKEGQWKVDIPRDGTDPDPAFNGAPTPNARYVAALLAGRRMRGEAMAVQLQAANPQVEAIFRRLDTEWSPSMETK